MNYLNLNAYCLAHAYFFSKLSRKPDLLVHANLNKNKFANIILKLFGSFFASSSILKSVFFETLSTVSTLVKRNCPKTFTDFKSGLSEIYFLPSRKLAAISSRVQPNRLRSVT